MITGSDVLRLVGPAERRLERCTVLRCLTVNGRRGLGTRRMLTDDHRAGVSA